MSLADPNRRQVLCGLAVALIAPGALAACSSSSTPTGSTPQAPGGSVPLAQVPVGGGTIITGASGPVLVVQPTAGTVKAFNASCPHQGTTVDPPQGGTIICPNHFSQFDASTGALKRGPAQTGLEEVAASVVNGNVQLA